MAAACRAHEQAWRTEDLEQRGVAHARRLWARYRESNRRDVEERTEQLRSFSNLSAYIAGFAGGWCPADNREVSNAFNSLGLPSNSLQRHCLQRTEEACTVVPAREPIITKRVQRDVQRTCCLLPVQVTCHVGGALLLSKPSCMWLNTSFRLRVYSHGAHTVQPAANPVSWQPPAVWPHNCGCGEQCCDLCRMCCMWTGTCMLLAAVQTHALLLGAPA